MSDATSPAPLAGRIDPMDPANAARLQRMWDWIIEHHH
jgi:hypothetical protein